MSDHAEREFVFTCPSCGDPGAQTRECSVDVHSGATYRCASCGAEVIFTAQTPEQYCAAVQLAGPAREPQTLSDEQINAGIDAVLPLLGVCGICGRDIDNHDDPPHGFASPDYVAAFREAIASPSPTTEPQG